MGWDASFISPVQAVFFTSDPVWTAHSSSLARTGEPLKSHNISKEDRGGDTGLYPKGMQTIYSAPGPKCNMARHQERGQVDARLRREHVACQCLKDTCQLALGEGKEVIVIAPSLGSPALALCVLGSRALYWPFLVRQLSFHQAIPQMLRKLIKF